MYKLFAAAVALFSVASFVAASPVANPAPQGLSLATLPLIGSLLGGGGAAAGGDAADGPPAAGGSPLSGLARSLTVSVCLKENVLGAVKALLQFNRMFNLMTYMFMSTLSPFLKILRLAPMSKLKPEINISSSFSPIFGRELWVPFIKSAVFVGLICKLSFAISLFYVAGYVVASPIAQPQSNHVIGAVEAVGKVVPGIVNGIELPPLASSDIVLAPSEDANTVNAATGANVNNSVDEAFHSAQRALTTTGALVVQPRLCLRIIRKAKTEIGHLFSDKLKKNDEVRSTSKMVAKIRDAFNRLDFFKWFVAFLESIYRTLEYHYFRVQTKHSSGNFVRIQKSCFVPGFDVEKLGRLPPTERKHKEVLFIGEDRK
ncbi:hypothetical protein SCHPADRAFT_893949 [Schizopora paradoxa]|uniref:Uncharacterized protein n=1 Tax=Schizopora paradoxa TaxID=27342 RepID=A0A0H2RAA5_9AGAM|nr:hypothetical protein SCHPADRAFT_893949 [Schizopora paradoxa]